MDRDTDAPPAPEVRDLDRLLELDSDSTYEDFVAALDNLEPTIRSNTEEANVEALLAAFKRANHIVTSKKAPKFHRLRWRPFLAAALVLIMLILVAGAAIQNFYKFMVKDDTMIITPTVQSGAITLDDSTNEFQYHSLAEALAANSMPAIEPTWIPTAFSLVWVKSELTDQTLTVSAWYAQSDKEENGFLIRVTDYQNDPDIAEILEIESKSGTPETINDAQYFIAPNGSRYKAVWNINSYLCAISGQLTKEELLQIISSINKGC